MKMEFKNKWPIAAVSLLGMTAILSAARNTDKCAPTPPTTCYPDECRYCYCLGPENYAVNPPTCPKTCNGDFTVTVAGFYWNAHQDGMEYAVDNQVAVPDTIASLAATQGLNNVVDAQFKTPHFEWDFGFKLGLGYCAVRDGWDFGILWTWYRGKANDEVEREPEDNATLVTLWSAYAPLQGGPTYATTIETHWKLQLNLIDLELGRSFWTSKYLSLRPFIGLRIAFIEQDFEIWHKGGSFSANGNTEPNQFAYNNEVDLDNDFKGVGIRTGLNSVWNIGCGWGIYGNFAFSLIYGRFDVDYFEWNKRATDPHDKLTIADIENNFRATRAIADLALGVQWQTMFCDCQYGFTLQLGWEQHLFWDQNQLWRINRIGDDFLMPELGFSPLNNTGENIFIQRRGDLDTQGWTLTLKFDF